MSRKIEELKIGDTAEFKAEITLNTHKDFMELSGDRSPVHTDNAFAKKAGFQEKIGYAFHAASYLSRLYGEYLPGGTSVCLSQSMKFVRPFFVGDTLTVRGTITHISTSVKVVTIENQILNQNGEVCITGEALVKMIV